VGKEQAVKAAGERLESIERWTRATFLVAAAGVGILALMAAGIGYVGLDYLRFKRGMAEASRLRGDPRPAASSLRVQDRPEIAAAGPGALPGRTAATARKGGGDR
jgi:hypothetical protein